VEGPGKTVIGIKGKTSNIACSIKNLGNMTVSWIRHHDTHLLTTGMYRYTPDDRFSTLHKPSSENWVLEIRNTLEEDEGVYECQISTTPIRSLRFNLKVVEKVGCPENHIKLDSDTCVKFLEDSTKCSDGCTRFTAKEECEWAGGFLLDYLETGVLNEFLKSVGSISESIKQSFWWTGASDFSKEGKGKFTWEKSDKPVDIDPDVWVNVSSLEVAGKMEGDSHQCVFLGSVNVTQVTLLDHADCRESKARPLCQFVAR